MLKRKNRLTKKADFDLVKHKGSRFSAKFIFVNVLLTNNTLPRIGIIVSKNVSKLAVNRNRAKRLVRVAVAEILPKMRSADIVIVAKSNIIDAGLQEVSSDIADIFSKAKLI